MTPIECATPHGDHRRAYWVIEYLIDGWLTAFTYCDICKDLLDKDGSAVRIEEHFGVRAWRYGQDDTDNPTDLLGLQGSQAARLLP